MTDFEDDDYSGDVPAIDSDEYRGYWEDEDGEGHVAFDPAEYDAGSFAVGDRVRLTAETDTQHIGALGTVVKVETEDEDGDEIIFPIVVWLDVFPKPTKIEQDNGFGLPLCAKELEHA